MKGLIFDIKEFAVYDGPGIRTTVFCKGCPLRCKWCHNPEGLEMCRQLMVSVAACTHCGVCRSVCTHDSCVACGACVSQCKAGLRKLCGQEITPEELSARLLRDRSLWQQTGGGVTFSGGEPLLQWPFLREVLSLLPDTHTLIETSGFASPDVFAEAVERLSMVIMDIKLMDSAAHVRWTGQPNEQILHNAQLLLRSQTPCIIRVPLIPGVNDTEENIANTARFLKGHTHLLRVELLPYHQTAGAKYEMLGKEYAPPFSTTCPPRVITEPFERLGIPVVVL